MYLIIYGRGGSLQRYFFLNLLVVFVVDVLLGLLYTETLPIRIKSYLLLLFFQLLYFTYFYSSYFRYPMKLVIWILGILSIVACYYFQYRVSSYAITSYSLLIYSCFLVFLSLAWFYKSIQDVSEQSLLRMLPFWVASANLLWGGFYIFMAVGIHYLYAADRELSLLMGKLFSCVNIVTYLSYLIGLTMVHRVLPIKTMDF